MNFNHLFVPLGVDSTPIGQRKCIDPFVGAALVTGGAGVLGNLLGLSSQKKANDANLQATRETNQMNYQIASEANRMSQEQFYQNLNWLKSQYYDTDSYARLRQNLAQGGLNPALAYGSASPVGSVGQASPTAFHAAQMEAGHVDPLSYDGLFGSVGSAVNAYFDSQLKSAQSENLSADSQIKYAQAFTEFASRLADIRSKYADIELKLSQKGVSEATRNKLVSEKDKIDSEVTEFWSLWDERQKAAKYGNKILERQERGLELDNDIKEIEKQFRPQMLRVGIRLSRAQEISTYEHIRLIMPQIESMQSEGKLTDAKTIAQFLSNGQDAINFLEKNHLYEMYNKNGLTKKGHDFFYMLGDLLSKGVIRNLPK